ncbi:MAG: tetrahydrofolate dehydrogenase/cyclohydrolase catalytic domain-containing protein [Eubacteriales bacterium]|nr:tetrahydrofolate dehydrogenase/cyclohydrolase catalytic domain-containing protein [Eubacteriales bacterium]
MAMILDGKKVGNDIDLETQKKVEDLKGKGIEPRLAIIRMGEKPDDIYYEKSAIQRSEKLGIRTKSMIIGEDATQAEAEEAMKSCSDDAAVHGILMLRPMGRHIDEEAVIKHLNPCKDIDGITPDSLGGVFLGKRECFAPCTPEACMRLLAYYDIKLLSKNVVVIGRSLVVGKPLVMMLLAKHATVTICHTRTADLAGVCRKADILVAAAGKAKLVTEDFVSNGQTVIDVGINTDENGRLVGDVDYAAVERKALRITPVPGGVGSVTTSVLLNNVVNAAINISGIA